MPTHRSLNQNFFKTWTQEMAYVLGFFAADGSMVAHKNGGKYIEFHITDRCILERIASCTDSTHRITERPVRNENHKAIYRIQIGSKEWYADLGVLGFTQNKSKILCFPRVPPEFLGDFTRGCFDGDGCVHIAEYFSKEKKKMIWVFTSRFICGTPSFLVDLHNALKKRGIRGGYIHTKKGACELVFSRHDSVALYRLMYHTGLTAGLYLPRKHETFERAIRLLYPSMRL